MSTNELLNRTLNEGRAERVWWVNDRAYLHPNPLVTCKDGYTISIQCQESNYCEPRLNFEDVSKYSSFELGFPSSLDSILEEYAETPDTVYTVFGYVPRDVVIKLIELHGGIVQE